VTALVLLSGGLDSTVVLHLAARRFGRVRALSIHYGQRHADAELERARAIAVAAGVPHAVERIELPWSRNALTGAGAGPIASRAAVVPGRNAILVTLAGAHAAAHGCGEVWIGCCAADAATFPDCRPEWIEAMGRALAVSMGVLLAAPLLDRTKAQIVRAARELGADAWSAIGLSWSCYSPDDGRPCGACGACGARIAGFRDAGIADPAMEAP